MSKIKRRSKMEWKKIVAEQEHSGVSARVFCQKSGVGEASFYKWRKRLGSSTLRANKTTESEAFIEVRQIAPETDVQAYDSTSWNISLELGDGIKLTLQRS